MVDFATITQKSLENKIQCHIFSWCPTMDLIVVGDDTSLSLYRLSGQRVWVVKKANRPRQVAWRYDGRILAVGYTDGSYQILSTSKGKVIYSVAGKYNHNMPISTVNWVRKSQIVDAFQTKIDTPDILKSLPKLPSLPVVGAPGSVFTSKNAIEELVQENPRHADFGVDLLSIGTTHGILSLHLYGLYSVEDITSSQLRGTVDSFISSEDLSNHVIVTEHEGQRLLISCSTEFIQRFGHYLSEVSLTPAKVLSMAEYISDTIKILQTEAKTVKQSNKLIIDGLNSEIDKVYEESHNAANPLSSTSPQIRHISPAFSTKGSVESELFDSLITGHLSQAMVQWLQNHVSDRELKKWKKSCSTSLETCRKVLFENYIPACERMLVLLSRLSGLSCWKQRAQPLGLNHSDFELTLELASSLLKLGTKCIQEISKECTLYTAFSSWVTLILAGLSQVSPKDSEGLTVRTIDVAQYITNYVSKGSSLNQFLDPSDTNSIFNLFSQFQEACEKSFSSTKQSMKSQTKLSSPIALCSSDCLVKTYLNSTPGDNRMVYLCLWRPGSTIVMVRFDINSFQQDQSFQMSKVSLGAQVNVIQIEFVDDQELIILMDNDPESTTDEPTRSMISIHYSELEFVTALLQDGVSLEQYVQQLQFTDISIEKSRTFDKAFKPSKIAVNGEKGRRVGAVLDDDGQRYIFFDIDNNEDEDEDEDDAEE